MKRTFSVLLILCLVLSLLPFGALADDVPAGFEDYIPIRDYFDLYDMQLDLTANYVLVNDIDLTEALAEGGDLYNPVNAWISLGWNNVETDRVPFTGVLDGNPIHRDMLWAARAARLAFVLNVVIDGGKRIVRAFAGDADAAHRAGAAFLDGFARIDVPEADVCVTGNGGAPLDQNVYQCVKGMSAAETVVRPGGAIVLCAECADGHGGRSFFEHLRDFSARELLAQCAATPRDATVPDQWQYQIAARIMDKAHVVFVSPPERHAELRAMRFEAAATLKEGVALARRLCGDGDAARVAVLPDGVSVVPVRV